MTAASPARAERARLRRLWPDEYDDGARCAFHQTYPGKREVGGYPAGFHAWALERRNAWYAGYLVGRQRRLNGVAYE